MTVVHSTLAEAPPWHKLQLIIRGKLTFPPQQKGRLKTLSMAPHVVWRFVITLIWYQPTVAGAPHVTFAQKNSTEHAKQRRAEQVADRFVNRFRATLDFGIAWKAFRLSDPSCTHRANGNLGESDYERFKLSNRTIEKLYISTMNLYYLIGVYELSLARIGSQSDSDDSLAPNEVNVIQKRSKFEKAHNFVVPISKEYAEAFGLPRQEFERRHYDRSERGKARLNQTVGYCAYYASRTW